MFVAVDIRAGRAASDKTILTTGATLPSAVLRILTAAGGTLLGAVNITAIANATNDVSTNPSYAVLTLQSDATFVADGTAGYWEILGRDGAIKFSGTSIGLVGDDPAPELALNQSSLDVQNGQAINPQANFRIVYAAGS